ncbi:MAG: acyltransferase family protein [Rubrivivax sp.]
MDTSNRLHALDNLRATMMWLGIVLHVAVNHMVGPSPLPWRDPATTPVADLLLAAIHAFRMPVFFIVAGFFAALLLQRRGAGGLLKHRFRRIALPLLLLGPPIVAATMAAGLAFVHRVARGTWGLDPSLVSPARGGFNMAHLWFLYLLWWFCVAVAAVAALQARLPALRGPTAAGARLLRRLGAAPWGFVLLALPLALAGAAYPNGVVTPTGRLLPPPAEWVHNGFFFAFGLALWGARESLLPRWQRRWGAYLLAGVPLFLVTGAMVERHAPAAAIALAYNATTWLWSLGLIGLFLRHASGRHALGAYLADGAYWVYLVHLPIAVGLGAWLALLPLGAAAKMGINIALTTVLALASYQLLVRHTAIGRLLNGRREPAQTRALQPAAP